MSVPKMTAQQTFNEAVGKILEQGELGLVNNRCFYKKEVEGKTIRCVVGGLIPDENYNPVWDTAGGVPAYKCTEILNILENLGYDQQTMIHLQGIHDGVGNNIPGAKDFKLNIFIDCAKIYASGNNLEWIF